MPDYLNTAAVLDFPGPSIEQVVAQVTAQAKTDQPVATKAIAQALTADERIVEDRLNQALVCRLVSFVHGKGWIPPVK
jgi:hypothetical protein